MAIFSKRPSIHLRAPARAGLAVATVLTLAACSSLEIAYSFADDMLEGRAEEYLDLSAEQEIQLEAQSAALIAWHRREMLPQYAAFFIAQAEIAETGGWTRPQLTGAFAKFRALVDATVEGAAPFIAEILAGHTTPEKRAYLENRMDENLALRRAEAASETPADHIDKWVDRRIDRIERLTGPLSDDQVTVIRRYTAQGMDNAPRWLENREYRQDALLAFLGARPSTPEIAKFVHRILLHSHEIVDPDYRAVRENRWALREAMYFDILLSLSDEQRQDLVERLRGYAADMIDLAGA